MKYTKEHLRLFGFGGFIIFMGVTLILRWTDNEAMSFGWFVGFCFAIAFVIGLLIILNEIGTLVFTSKPKKVINIHGDIK